MSTVGPRPVPYRSDHTWRLRAVCRGIDNPEIFYPTSGARQAAQPALDYCHVCPVARECLDDELAHGRQPWGVRGGLTEAERRRLVRARNEAKRVAV